MFQSLRQNSQIYIFKKGVNPTLERGIITNIPTPKPKPYNQQMPPYLQPQEMVVDLVAKVNNQIINLNNIPAHLEVADTFYNGESIVIADNRDAMNAEVYAYKQISIDAINNIDMHKNIVVGCDDILRNLNPEYADKQQHQLEMDELKVQLSNVTKNVSDLMEMNRQLMEQLNRKEQKNE